MPPKHAVQAIDEWLQTQPHLPKITEGQKRLFLQSCYDNIKDTTTTIDNYFTFKTKNPEFFNFPTDPAGLSRLEQSIDTSFSGILPRRTPEGYIILLIKMIDVGCENYIYQYQCQQFFMGMMLHLHKNELANGIVVIFDAKDYSLAHMWKSKLSLMKRAVYWIQEALPVRIKAFHVINITPVIPKMMVVARPLLKKELSEMVQFHPSNCDDLYKTIPKKCLIKEYGGHLPSYLEINKERKKFILENKEFFDWHSSQTVDESKRSKEPKKMGIWSRLGF